MSSDESLDLTKLLNRFSAGDATAADEIIPILFNELRKMAELQLRKERPHHTLQPTALVNELYLEIAGRQTTWQGRAHFFGFAARVMRSVLVDHARERAAQKRGGGQMAVALNQYVIPDASNFELTLQIDNALEQLAQLDHRQAQVVELRYFGGLTEEEIGLVLGISARTVKRDWVLAKAWLATSMVSHKSDGVS